MKRVAVFGNSGAGKSTLARRLAGLTGLPLYPLDLIQFKPGGMIDAAATKQVHHLRSPGEIRGFLDAVANKKGPP